MQNVVIPPQTQALQVPGHSGVNIQIFNPTVGTPGSNYNVNSPCYHMGGCYPAGYYTGQWGPQNGVPPAGGTQNTGQTGTAQGAGMHGGQQAGQDSQIDTKDTNQNGNGQNNGNLNSTNTTTNESNKTITEKTEEKKTEKRTIVELTDDYIKTLENYLNSQDPEVRLMGAKEVVARAEEDDSRKNDAALNALTNKMLQDPSAAVKIMALGLLDSRSITGDDYSIQLLKNMQESKTNYGHDALQATNILLKMAGKQVEKEFEVKADKKTEEKTKSKNKDNVK